MKKVISLLLAFCIMLPCAVICAHAESAPLKCVVVGSPSWLFGTMFDKDNTDNIMEHYGDGFYSRTYTAEYSFQNVELKVYVEQSDTWYGDKNGNSLVFNITEPGRFTVVFDSTSKTVDVYGDIIQGLHYYEPFYVYGNGDEGWLNNAADNAISYENEMEQTSYYPFSNEIYYLHLPGTAKNTNREFRICYDGRPEYISFGGTFPGYDVWTDAVFGGDPVTFDVDGDNSDLYIFLDLKDFDYYTLSGARFAVVRLREGEDFRLPEKPNKRYVREFQNQFSDGGESSELECYEELYYHTRDGETDWTLIHAYTDEQEPLVVFGEFGDRFLHKNMGGVPFELDYGIYDVKQNKFIGLETAYKSGDYPDLTRVMDLLNIGRLRGDIDLSGTLSINDATEMQRVLAEYRSYPDGDAVWGYDLISYREIDTENCLYISDVNKDGKRDINDVTEIQCILAGF